MKITRFEDLQCWQEARILVNMVYQAIRNSAEFQKDFRKVSKINSGLITYLLKNERKPNKPNKLDKLDKLDKPKRPDKPDKLNKRNRPEQA